MREFVPVKKGADMELITSPQFIIAMCLFTSLIALIWIPIELEIEDDDPDNDELF